MTDLFSTDKRTQGTPAVGSSDLLGCPTCGIKPETRQWHTYCPKCGLESAFGETPEKCKSIWNIMVAGHPNAAAEARRTGGVDCK